MISQTLAKTATMSFWLCVSLYGAFIAGVALHEPDTCFLLALGRWIVTHRCIPQTDPFSYTYQYIQNEHPFVVHQWLTDVSFYLLHQWGGPVLLVVFTSAVLTVSYVGLCALLMVKLGLHRVAAIGICIAVMLGTMFSAQTRPEIFTIFFCALLVNVIAGRNRTSTETVAWLTVISMSIILCFWTNFHTGYALGVCLLGLRLLSELCFWAAARLRREAYKIDLVWFFALPASILATFLNPYGAWIWLYLPHHFFNEINATINELQPLNFQGLSQPGSWVFIALGIIFVARLIRRPRTLFMDPKRCFFILAGLAAIAAALRSMRMYSIADILLVGAIASFSNKNEGEESIFWRRLAARLAGIWTPEKIAWQFRTVTTAVACCVLITLIVPMQIPMSTSAFKPPIAAASFIARHPLQPNLLNDPHFGDVLMWHAKTAPLLFIDSRYDVYSLSLLNDYWTMYDCKPGWRDLLAKYGINSIFLPPSAPLAKTLAQESGWSKPFSDTTCVVLEKTIEK